ncbi:Ig-like domain repeat protein [Pseudofrankia inefficax]|uniref:Uncharacterized protein n=1 Tax=Pseudofrankia inefficax (strain DSM 45817 / CECT 9037 / DDB 130130 / EuI1c) TaxID=298654 RepID=E3JBG6_PSEI1|nr:Ig-like domain repeat protein [Pseudofrankia inefficax]ADP79838.1 hypothetical protein FraEuI1c_1782 [Pseudofrankia inefficax]
MRRHLSSAVPASLVMTMLAACGFLLTSCHSPYLPGVGGGPHPTASPSHTVTPTPVRKPVTLNFYAEPSLDPTPPVWFIIETATDHVGQLPGEPHPTGTMTVVAGGVSYGTQVVSLQNDVEYGVNVHVPPGRYDFVVDYSGDANYLPAHKAYMTIPVGP